MRREGQAAHFRWGTRTSVRPRSLQCVWIARPAEQVTMVHIDQFSTAEAYYVDTVVIRYILGVLSGADTQFRVGSPSAVTLVHRKDSDCRLGPSCPTS